MSNNKGNDRQKRESVKAGIENEIKFAEPENSDSFDLVGYIPTKEAPKINVSEFFDPRSMAGVKKEKTENGTGR